MNRTPLGLSIFALALSACTSLPPTAERAQPIINGTTDDGDPNVVMMFAQVPGASGGALCTAEVVSPHVVLTAAHCVSPASVGSGNVFIVFTGSVFGSMPPAEQVLKVAEVHWMPTWKFANGEDVDDVGVLILESPTTITPLTYNHFALPQSANGSPLRLVGYGITDGTDMTGKTAGTKHTAPSSLQLFRDQTLTIWDNLHSNCEGDSGGPALMMLDGKERIVGITQVGYTGCPVKLAATDTRIDAYASYVDQWVNQLDPAAVAPGGACTADAECGTLPCLNGVCTPPCDPNAMTNSCPAGLTCSDVNGESMCAKGHKGCSMVAGAADTSGGGWLVVLLVAAALSRRRLARSIAAR